MSNRETRAKAAFDTLMDRIGRKDQSLFEEVRRAVDAGKETTASKEADDRAEGDLFGRQLKNDSRKKVHAYRARNPYSHEEALRVVLDVLRAYFIELPLLTTSTVRNLDEVTEIEIDRQVETQISGISSDNFLLKEAPEEKIQEQMRNFSTLEELTAFRENSGDDVPRPTSRRERH